MEDKFRMCNDCNIQYILNEYNFYRNKRQSYWFCYRCKSCDKKRKKSDRYIDNRRIKKRRISIHKWFIYILYSWWYYKIWVTKNNDIYKRINELSIWNPIDIKLVSSFIAKEDVFTEERNLHNMFKHKKVRWEWFSLDKEDIEAINSIYK